MEELFKDLLVVWGASDYFQDMYLEHMKLHGMSRVIPYTKTGEVIAYCECGDRFVVRGNINLPV